MYIYIYICREGSKFSRLLALTRCSPRTTFCRALQRQEELVGVSLIADTGDFSIDEQMKKYRRAVDKTVKRGEVERTFMSADKDDQNEEAGVDKGAEAASALFANLNKKMFLTSNQPLFSDYCSHMPSTTNPSRASTTSGADRSMQSTHVA